MPLRGVDDSYPPQKKSFMMLKYMHDHYLDKYEWFMRADDDVYIKGDLLESFLRSLNSSEPLFLGQTGDWAPQKRWGSWPLSLERTSAWEGLV